jgi:hypothetical protein
MTGSLQELIWVIRAELNEKWPVNRGISIKIHFILAPTNGVAGRLEVFGSDVVLFAE